MLAMVMALTLFVGCFNCAVELTEEEVEERIERSIAEWEADEWVDGGLIALVQNFSHPALDAAREGFVAALAEEGFVEGVNVQFREFNAQGDVGTLASIATQVVEENPFLILSIATGTTQALAHETQTIPIVITAVTDPLQAGVIYSLERPGTNVTGTSDLTPVDAQFNLMLELLPETQTVGIIYNAGEVNSVIQADMAAETAATLGLNYIRRTVTGTHDIAQIAEATVGMVDVIYVPTCNTIAAAYATLVMVADEAGVPVIVGERAGVTAGGALATSGIDYYLLGRQAGAMAAQIMRGEAIPPSMPIQWQDPARTRTTINTESAERLGITIPEHILEIAELVVTE